MSGDGLRDEIAAAIADHTARCSCCPTIDEPVKLANWLVPTVQARVDAAREQVAEQIAQAIEARAKDGTWNVGGQVVLEIAAGIARERVKAQP